MEILWHKPIRITELVARQTDANGNKVSLTIKEIRDDALPIMIRNTKRCS